MLRFIKFGVNSDHGSIPANPSDNSVTSGVNKLTDTNDPVSSGFISIVLVFGVFGMIAASGKTLFSELMEREFARKKMRDTPLRSEYV